MELLERDAHLQELGELLGEAAAGRGRLVFLAGEAGVGKTALVERFCQSIQRQATVLVGGCDPLSTPRALGPLLDVASRVGGDLEQVLLDGSSRERIFDALLAELSRGPRPHVVVIEDVHWSDEATLDLLRFVGRRLGPLTTLLIATYRDDELGPRHPLRVMMGDLATVGVVRRMHLPPLSAAAVAVLATGSRLDPLELYRLTEGNPFFLTEVLAAGTGGVPPTVRDAVLARVARLSDRARAALETAAVLGSRAEARLLEQVAPGDIESIDACVHAGVLLTDGHSFTFRHELARQTVVDTLSPQRAIDIHRRILRALDPRSQQPDYAARLAHHAEGAGDPEAVLAFAPAAARRAAELGAHREAAAQYARALRFADAAPPVDRARLLEAYSSECSDTSQLEEAIRALREAVELWRVVGDRLREGESLTRLARPLIWAGHNAEGEAASQASLALLETLPPGPELAFACTIQAGLRTHKHDDAEAIAWGGRAIALAEQVGATETLVHALNMVGMSRLHRGEEQGVADVERSLTLARAAGLHSLVGLAYLNLGSVLTEQHQFSRAERYLDPGLAWCADYDLDHYGQYILACKGLAKMYRGLWQAALQTAQPIADNPHGGVGGRVTALVAVGRVLTRRGDPRASAVLNEAVQVAHPTDELQFLGPVRTARAEMAWWAGDLSSVRTEARAAFDLAVSRRHAWLIGELGYWLWRAGEMDAPPTGAAEPFALQIAGDWAGAAAQWAALGCPYEQARALAEGDNVGSLREALRVAQALGARELEVQIARALRTHGVRVSPALRAPPQVSPAAPLSRREAEVATLVAQGCTNREIAERLVISERTAENHLQRILNRLRLRSRTEIATWAVKNHLA